MVFGFGLGWGGGGGGGVEGRQLKPRSVEFL